MSIEWKRFRYLIFDSFNGTVLGTDDPEVAQTYAESDQDWVVNLETFRKVPPSYYREDETFDSLEWSLIKEVQKTDLTDC